MSLLQEKYNLNQDFFNIFEIIDQLEKEDTYIQNNKIWYNFNIQVADVYKDITFYYASIFDNRLRVYFCGWSFHKASNVYKFLTLSSIERELDDNGKTTIKNYNFT